MAKRKRENGAARWDSAMEGRFIELWQQYSCLYDVSARDYHDRLIKDQCWQAISEALHQPIVEVQTKATSLRTQYSRILHPKNGDKELTSRQRWILNSLQFLQPFIVQRGSQSALTLDDLEHVITDEGGEDQQEIEKDVSESSTSTPHHTSRPSTPLTLPEPSSSHHRQVANHNPERQHYSKSKKKSRDISLDELEREKVNILKNVSETLLDVSHDVDETFGRQVITEMKLIKNPLTKMRLRRSILMMLYDAHEHEMKLQSHSDSQQAFWPQTPWQGHTNHKQNIQTVDDDLHACVPPVQPAPAQTENDVSARNSVAEQEGKYLATEKDEVTKLPWKELVVKKEEEIENDLSSLNSQSSSG
ncbi:uncharacterized protein [Paramisgurnus dabryanus]|uniref:uncharacterized protein isoform X1 n=1 Tax=Paramisgurnus dabryanus TaxID=90735 RepID=UPI0031F4718B